jgi:hypothetical protein
MNDRHAINEREEDARRALVALARAMLTRDVSFLEGAIHALHLKSEIGGLPDRDLDFDAFVVIASETDHLPLKAQQHLWNPETLAKLAPEYQKMERWAAGFARAACENLIRRFGDTAEPPAEQLGDGAN